MVFACVWMAASCQTIDFGSKNAERIAEWKVFATKGQKFLERGEFDLASKSFNDALKRNITNAKLQALNGIAYHLSAREKDFSNFALAEQGYKLSAKFDPANWEPHYLLGLVNIQQKKYNSAKLKFIQAVVRNPKSEKIWFHLLAAAYYSMDFDLAGRVAKFLLKQKPTDISATELNRSCALIFAALNKERQLGECLGAYNSSKVSDKKKAKVLQKITLWKHLHSLAFKKFNKKSVRGFIPVQETTDQLQGTTDQPVIIPKPRSPAAGIEQETRQQPQGVQQSQEPFEDADTITDERMVVVDVVIIGTLEDNRVQSGINLLDGLSFQFGDTANSISALSKSTTISRDMDDAENNSTVRAIVRAITIPAINYSMNIINSSNSYSKILAKPSLIALSGQNSEFFSGVTVTGAATSGTGDSISIEKEIGVTLSVTPQFIDDDKILLHVEAERTFLMDPSTSVIFDYRVDTTQTSINSTVVLNIGDTLVLGGLSEQEDTDSLDGVPMLRDIPILKLLFSQEEERRYKKSITIMLTPRIPNATKYTQQNQLNEKKIGLTPNEFLLEQFIGERGIFLNRKEAGIQRFKRTIGYQYVSVDDFNVKESTSGIVNLANTLTEFTKEL